MLAKNERRDVGLWCFAVVFHDDPVDDRELDVGIIGRDSFEYRALCKADTDDQIKTLFRVRAHRGFDRRGTSRFDVVEADRHVSLSTLDAFPGGGVERPVVLSAYVEDDTHLHLTAFASSL